MDFKKAFDSVPHERLLVKLSKYRIRGSLLNCIRHFLTGRLQRVTINGTLSSWTEVLSGIPQRSVLGTTLFVCFINDLPETISSAVQIFADDTKIYRAISTSEDNSLLQKELDSVMKWSQEWQLHFNEKQVLGPAPGKK